MVLIWILTVTTIMSELVTYIATQNYLNDSGIFTKMTQTSFTIHEIQKMLMPVIKSIGFFLTHIG